jgi:hypothetical protein
LSTESSNTLKRPYTMIQVDFIPRMIQHIQINKGDSINRIKDKSHIIISIDAEKAFDKIQHPCLIKALKKLGIEGIFLYIIKAKYI